MESSLAEQVSQPDKKHRDWLLYSTQALIANVDTNITTEILVTPEDGRLLKVSGISEEAIQKLSFLTNTDQNNNYLYLEDFKVYIGTQFNSLNIPGLVEICKNFYRRSDADAFVEGKKTQLPFSSGNVTNATIGLPDIAHFNEFIDLLTTLLPYVKSTIGHVKTYELILNPDDFWGWLGSWGAPKG